MKYTYPPNAEKPGYSRVIEVGDTVCYKGERAFLAVVAKVQSLDYGAGRVLRKAMVIWLNGKRSGRKQLFDVRDWVTVEK